MDKKQIGKTLLKAKGKTTYYRLSENSDLTQSQIESIENGEKAYTIDSLLSLSNALGFDVVLVPRVDFRSEPNGNKKENLIHVKH